MPFIAFLNHRQLEQFVLAKRFEGTSFSPYLKFIYSFTEIRDRAHQLLDARASFVGLLDQSIYGRKRGGGGCDALNNHRLTNPLDQKLGQSYRNNNGGIDTPDHHFKTVESLATRVKALFDRLVSHGTFTLMRFNLCNCFFSGCH